MQIFKTIENEIRSYVDGQVQIVPGYYFSQYQLIKRIMMFSNNKYKSGNIDSQGNYKYWYDIIGPRVDDEIKNIDFDTKDILLYSEQKKDSSGIFILNMGLREWMKNNEQAIELNDSVEEGAAQGNVVWKKIKGGYQKCDLLNFYVINQLAETLDDTPVIERAEMTQTQLRMKKDVWNNVEEVIKNCRLKGISSTKEGEKNIETELAYYEIFERNGEISLKDYKEAKNSMNEDDDKKEKIEEGDEDKFILAKIIVAGLETKGGASAGKGGSGKYILFANEIKEMPYKEYHRGKYTGRWWRKGIYEILFDIQIRANECGNQIARALEYGARQNFWTEKETIYKNILTDMQRGDIIHGKVERIDMKMTDIANYIQEWNLLHQQADKLCKTFEVVQGETVKNVPFRSSALANMNANKFYDFLREKLGLAIKSIFQDWILPDLMKNIKAKDVLRLTGSTEYLNKCYELLANSWYVKNLAAFGPHTSEQAEMVKMSIMNVLKQNPELYLKLKEKAFDGIRPRIQVLITGEAINLQTELNDLATFIGLEMDPVRRTALIEQAMHKKGIDISTLPKSSPEQLQGVAGATQPREPNNNQTLNKPAEAGEKQV